MAKRKSKPQTRESLVSQTFMQNFIIDKIMKNVSVDTPVLTENQENGDEIQKTRSKPFVYQSILEEKINLFRIQRKSHHVLRALTIDAFSDDDHKEIFDARKHQLNDVMQMGMGKIITSAISDRGLDFSPQHICINAYSGINDTDPMTLTMYFYYLTPKSIAIYQDYIDERESDRRAKERDDDQLVANTVRRTGKTEKEVREFLNL